MDPVTLLATIALLLYALAQLSVVIGLYVKVRAFVKGHELPRGHDGLELSVVELRLHRRVAVTFSNGAHQALLFLTPRSTLSRVFVRCLQKERQLQSLPVVVVCSGVRPECQEMMDGLPSHWTFGYEEKGIIAGTYGVVGFPAVISFSAEGKILRYAYPCER